MYDDKYMLNIHDQLVVIQLIFTQAGADKMWCIGGKHILVFIHSFALGHLVTA